MRVAVIGIGAIAPLHIKALQTCGQEIAALCDIEPERCKKTAQNYGLNAAIYTDYVQLLDRESLDAVHICTPHYLHAEMICAALDRGINVLCEKPLAINEVQLSEIEAAVHRSSAQLGVCFQNRYNLPILYIKDYFKDRPIRSAYANLTWCRDERYYASGAWRGTRAYEGGGVMINQAIHSLDALQWICGMPESVLAHLSNNSLQGVIEVEDTAFGIFGLKNGGNFVVHATNAAKSCFPVYMAFSSGKDTVELSANNLIVNGHPITTENNAPLFGKDEWGNGHATLISEFYRCLANGELFPINFYEARNAVCLILKMYESNGETIYIPQKEMNK